MNDSKFLGAITAFLFVCMLHCEASQYWVRPNTTVDCPVGVSTEHCITLSDIAANNSKYFGSNTEIRFLAGVHTVTDDYRGVPIGAHQFASIQHNVSLMGDTDSSGNLEHSTIIKCERNKFGFAFKEVHNLSLSRIAIVKCGFNYRLDPFTTINTSLFLESIENLLLEDVLITESIGFGLFGIALRGNIKIESCTFSYSNNIPNHNNFNGTLPGGNAHLNIRSVSPFETIYYRTSLNISNSVFAHGLLQYKRATQYKDCDSTLCYKDTQWSAGLYLYIIHTQSHFSTISLNNCTFFNNTAIYGANILTIWHTKVITDQDIPLHYKLMIDRCTIDNGRAVEAGGGIYIELIEDSLQNNVSVDFIFTNSTFSHNTVDGKGGAVSIKAVLYLARFNVVIQGNKFTENSANYGAAIHTEVKPWTLNWGYPEPIFINPIITESWGYPYEIMVINSDFISNKASKNGGAIFSINTNYRIIKKYQIEDCNFRGNFASIGSAVSMHYLQQSWPEKRLSEQKIKMLNCVFNNHHSVAGNESNNCSVIHLHGTENVYIENTSIIDNNCRGIHINMSTIEVGNNVWIVNNSATQGAGIFFDCYPLTKDVNVSRMILTNTTSLYIQDNHAHDYGGGIAAKSGCSNPNLCFFKHKYNLSTRMVYMTENTAGIAGTSIYGGYLEHCYMDLKAQLTSSIFWNTFNITDTSIPSVVASRSYKVCICTQSFTTEHGCSFVYSTDVYPGQTFHVPAVGVGQYNYSSPSVIRATVVNGYNAQLGEQQVTQDVNLLCKSLTYSLQTLETSVVIRLSIETPFSSETTLPELQAATLTVTILDCPLGFQLYKDSQTCDCLPHLANRGVTCNILDQTVHRSRSMWIGNFSDDIAVHHNCPFDYCDHDVTDLHLDNQEEQCDLNRTGILCGACQTGYSLVLGTSKCKKCSNVYLLLLLPILLSGFGLVVLLLMCNLTVSTGTINGLIFYANIIQVNNKVFFPPGSILVPGYILSIFIAWMNLDLGIEVCFAESLDTFTRTWLQFLFPIYIWLMVGLLILVCRYSTTVSRLTGSNTVPVLATLFLLSYAKLLRTTLNAFSPITITDRNNTEHLRWLLDGNYGFLHWPHLALFLAGLLTLMAHLIPFTALVLLGPTLQAHTDYRVLGWVTRFKPFLDAYQGPYKTKYRYWTGLMLLVRVFLFAVFAGNALGDPNVNLLTISLTILVLLIAWVKIGRAYRMSPLNGLELFFLVNLGVITVATLYLRATSDTNTQQQILSLIMVGSALIVFIGTLTYHCYSELTKTNCGKKLKRKAQAIWSSRQDPANEEIIGKDEGENQPQVKVESPTRTIVSLKELKEPLHC